MQVGQRGAGGARRISRDIGGFGRTDTEGNHWLALAPTWNWSLKESRPAGSGR